MAEPSYGGPWKDRRPYYRGVVIMDRSIRILLVDDDPADRAMATRVLKKGLGRVVIQEVYLREHLTAALKNPRPDVIITDFQLRELTGLEVIDLVRGQGLDTPIIMLTGTGTEDIALEAMKHGVADYVIKTAAHIERLPFTVEHALQSAETVRAKQRAEEALQSSEERYRHLVELTPDGIVVGKKGRIEFANNAFVKMLGYAGPDEVVGRRFLDFVKPDLHEEVRKRIRDFDAGLRGEQTTEDVYLRADGSEFPVEVVGTNFDLHGECRGMAMVRDITERKLAEEELRTEHARFVTAMDSLDALVYAADMETHELLFMNAYGHGVWGDHIGEKCWAVLQSGQAGPCESCTNDRLLDADGNPTGLCVRESQNTIDGQWYQCRDEAIRWPGGRMVRLEIATNITDRKRAEKTIEQRERYLAGLNDAAKALLSSAGVVPFQEFVDKIGPASGAGRAYVFLNHTGDDDSLLMSQMAEWCAEDITTEIDNPKLQNLSYDEFFPQWRDVLSRGEIVNGRVADFPDEERDILDPQNIQAILIIPIIVGDEFVGFVGFDNCVSDREWNDVERTFLLAATNYLAQAIRRNRSERQVQHYANNLAGLVEERTNELEASREQLRRSERLASIGTLAAGIAHEINNPTGGILMGARAALLEFDDSQNRDFVRKCLHEIIEDAQRCGRIVKSVLRFASQQPTEKWLNDINVLVKQASDMTREYVTQQGGQMALKLADDLPNVPVNPTEFQQVVVNLVRNAAYDAGRSTRVTVQTERLDNGVRLTVSDNGPGMSAEQLKRIFDPFYTTRQQKGGTGLGLSVVHGIVESHGGKIDVESLPERGTTFLIDWIC